MFEMDKYLIENQPPINLHLVTMDDILNNKDNCVLIGETDPVNDIVYQLYSFKNDDKYSEGYIGIIDKSIITYYFAEKGKEEKGWIRDMMGFIRIL